MDHVGWHSEADPRHGKFLLNFQEVQTPKEDEKRLAGGGGPRVLEQPGREPVSGVGGERQLFRFRPPGHPVRGQGDKKGDEQSHPREVWALPRSVDPRSVRCFEFQEARGKLSG